MIQSRPFAVPSLKLRLIFGYGTTCCVLGPPVALGQTGPISLNGPKQAICRPITATRLISRSKDGPSECEHSYKKPVATKAFISPHGAGPISKNGPKQVICCPISTTQVISTSQVNFWLWDYLLRSWTTCGPWTDWANFPKWSEAGHLPLHLCHSAHLTAQEWTI